MSALSAKSDPNRLAPRGAMSALSAKSDPNRLAPSAAMSALSAKSRLRHRLWQGLALAVVTLVLSSCGWRGIANVPIPGGPGGGPGAYTVEVQMPDTLALNGNSRVLVADVWVGTVRSITLKNWVATLTLGIDKDVKLPKNATAKIGQTSLLGSQHVELAAPPDPSPQPLKDGDVIPLKNASHYPNFEQVLASLALVLRGGGIPNLELLQDEIYNVVNGRAPQIRAFLGKLSTFTGQLNEQREDITRAIDSTDRLLGTLAGRADVLDRLLTEFPPLIKYFADKRQLFIDAVDATGQFSAVTDQYLAPTKDKLHQELINLQCPLKELAYGAPYVPDALKFVLSIAPTDVATKSIRGDYINVSAVIDFTYSAIDNSLFTGTGFMGALRALEQSFGRDPKYMIPDVRYTPNPATAEGGPYVIRGDRNC